MKNRVFSTENHFNNTIASFNKLSKNTEIDIAIFGSSHAYTAFNPLMIDKECGTTSFNLGSDDLRVPITGLILKEAQKKITPKLVILEIYPSSIIWPNNEKSKGYQLRVFDKISNFSIDKWEIAKKVYNNEELLGVYFPLFRNHQLWNKNKYFNLSREEKIDEANTFFYNGYIGKSLKMDTLRSKTFKDFGKKREYSNSDRVFINSSSEKDIHKLISIAKSENSKVLVVSAPDIRAKNYWNNTFISDMRRICSENNVKYLNMNDFYDQMNLTINDFKDPSHLNIKGAYKASKFLAEYIKTNYDFVDNKKINKNKNDSILKTFINDYIRAKEKYFKEKVNSAFTNNIILDSLYITKKGFNLEFELSFDKTNFSLEELKKFKLQVKIFPKESDLNLVNRDNIQKGWNYDKKDIKIENPFLKYLRFQIPTKINNIKKVEMFLYNKDEYSGPVGNRIFLNEINFN